MVFKRDSTTIVDGKIVKTPAQYIRFVKTPYGGHLETSDPEVIAFVEESSRFKEGLIVRFDGDIEGARKGEAKHAAPVHQGMVGSGSRAPEPKNNSPWANESREAGAAKVPEMI